MSLEIKTKLVREGAKLPKRATSGAAAADLYAVCDEDIVLKPHERVVVNTGVAIELPSNEYVALVFARSGLGIKKGITLSNGVGVIDSDYRGEIGVGLINLSDEEYIITNHERIAQIAVMPVASAMFVQSEELSDTRRGTGGFGSTGTKDEE